MRAFKRKRDDPRGEWGRQLARDGYTPFTHPVVRMEAEKDKVCCDRLLRYYSGERESTKHSHQLGSKNVDDQAKARLQSTMGTDASLQLITAQNSPDSTMIAHQKQHQQQRQ